MKKYLVRCGMLPFENIKAEDMLSKDRTGSNNGNLLYQYSVIKTLMTDDVEFFSDKYEINPDKADYINSTYDAYILPLADAFREDFQTNLINYTKLIQKLTIPVYVIGVGLRANYEPELEKGFPFDEKVKEFVQAVLNRSSLIGVRGEITGRYLETLGFNEDIHYKVIGCPSLFTNGQHMKIKDLTGNSNLKVALNASEKTNKECMEFIESMAFKYDNYDFIPQIYTELFLTYLGGASIKGAVEKYPGDINSKFYHEGKVKFFLNVSSWYSYMQNRDISLGTRFHGNVAAIINDTPAVTFVLDARMRELTSYHNLPSLQGKELNGTMELQDVLERVELKSPEKGHLNRFENYLSFLERNNLDHIYKESLDGRTRFTDLVNKQHFDEPVSPITTLDYAGIFKRIQMGTEIRENNFDAYLGRLNTRTNLKMESLMEEIRALKSRA